MYPNTHPFGLQEVQVTKFDPVRSGFRRPHFLLSGASFGGSGHFTRNEKLLTRVQSRTFILSTILLLPNLMASAPSVLFRSASLVAAFCFLLVASAVAQPVTQPFTFNISAHDLPAIDQGSAGWGDFDADGDLDLLLSGSYGDDASTNLFVNLGHDGDMHRFASLTGPFHQVLYSTSSFADVDGDGDLDVLVSGSTTREWPYSASTRLYRLQSAGPVEYVEGHGIPDLHSAAMAWGDLDTDGDLDLVMTGVTSDDVPTTVVAYNNGDGTFDADTGLLTGVGYGDVALGDIDGDLDPDIVLTGASDNGFLTQVLRNDAGTFSAVNGAFPPVAFSSVDLGDYDADGDLDLVISGGQVSEMIFEGQLQIWDNIGGSFSPSTHSMTGVLAGDVTWGDYDHDGDLDLLVYGAEAAIGRRSARMYRNDADAGFTQASLLVGGVFADAEFGDFDGDGDLDLITTGSSSLGPSMTNIYENFRQVIPELPGAPSALIAQVSDREATLSWQPPSDATDGLILTTYNVRVGTQPGGSDVVSAMAHPESGRRFTTGPGNASVEEAFLLSDLEDGTYFWSVQAVNNAFLASEFALEGTFTVNGSLSVDTETESTLPQRFAVYGNYPNPFTSQTTVRYDLPEAATVQFRVYSLLGQEVHSASLGARPAGQHQVQWDGRSSGGSQLGSGIYFYEVRADGVSASGTMTLVR